MPKGASNKNNKKGESSIEIFKALSDDTRFAIVSFLSKKESKNEVVSCKEISEKFQTLSQPTMSHHFKVLADIGIVDVTKSGTENLYKLKIDKLKNAGINIEKVF